MKRVIGITAAAAVIAMLGFSVMPANTYTYVVRELSQTFTAVQTFSSGIAVTSGQKLYLESSSGDSYLLRDADTGCWQMWRDGVLGWQICGNHAVMPVCPTDYSQFPLGSICTDPVTGHNKIKGDWEVIP